MVAFFTVFMTALGYRQPIAAPGSRILCHPTVTAPRHGDTREHENGTKWIQSWKFSENNYRHLNVSRYFENHARIAMEPEQHLPKYIFALIIFTEYPLFWMMSGYLKWKICLTLQEQGIVALLCAVHWRADCSCSSNDPEHNTAQGQDPGRGHGGSGSAAGTTVELDKYILNWALYSFLLVHVTSTGMWHAWPSQPSPAQPSPAQLTSCQLHELIFSFLQ